MGRLHLPHHLDEATRKLSLPVRGGVDVLADAVRRLEDTGVEVLDLGLRRPDLDDVFLTLTGHAAEESADAAAGDDAGRGTPEPAAAGGAAR